MKSIVADRDIPLLHEMLAKTGKVRYVDGRAITSELLGNAEILLVRSVTQVDKRLLSGSRVVFVGSATAGIDHVDVEYLRERGIVFGHAPGSNADSVADYVVAALYRVARERASALRGRTCGVVGFGNVGSRVAARLAAAGMEVVVNDPPLQEQDPGFAPDFEVATLDDLIDCSDVVTLHVPLNDAGRHPTRSLLGPEVIRRMRKGAWLVNTARGEVVHTRALLQALAEGVVEPAILDVFEGEPIPDRRLVLNARIATPHIAGYSLDSKLAGARAVADAVLEFVGAHAPVDSAETSPSETPVELVPPPTTLDEVAWVDELITMMYDIDVDSAALKTIVRGGEDVAAGFHGLRRNYPTRRLFARYSLARGQIPEHALHVDRSLRLQVHGGV